MKEFRDIVKVFIRARRILVVFMVVGVFLGAVRFIAERPSASFIVSLIRAGSISENADSVYAYDGYYLIETYRLFGERLGVFLRQPALFENDGSTLRGAFSSVRVQRFGVGDYRISASGTLAEADEYASLVGSFATEELSRVAYETGEYSDFGVTVSRAASDAVMPLYMRLIIGAALGSVLGAFWIAFREYFSGQ